MRFTFGRKTAYYYSEAFKSMGRNGFLSLATIATVMITLFILGGALLAVLNVSSYLQGLENDLVISAFVDHSYTQEQAFALQDQIAALDGIERITFVSRDEAMQQMQEKYSSKGYDLSSTLESNPLPDSFRIQVVDSHNVENIAEQVRNMTGIYLVNYGKEVTDKLFSVTKGVRWVGGITVVLTVIGAIFLIGINIRLSIFSRRKEIYLMKLLGATDSFITRPFYIEGILLALFGTLIAVGFVFGGYELLLTQWTTSAYAKIFPLIGDQHLLMECCGALVIGGFLLGWIGTAISVRRFMDV